MNKLLFTLLVIFFIVNVKAQVNNPMAMSGHWEGRWDNTTFQSFGLITADVTVDETAGTCTLAINSGGNILGEPRAPFNIVLTFDDNGWVADFNSPIWGDVDLIGTPDGAFNGGAANPPGGGADNMVMAGTLNHTEISSVSSFIWWGTPANGTENLTKQNPINDPSDLQAAETNSIQLNWTDNSNNELGFRIDRLNPDTELWEEIATVGQNVTTYLDEDVVAGKNYSYRIAGYHATTESEYSNVVDITTTEIEAVNGPTSLTAVETIPGVVDLSWTDNSDNEVSFRIERKVGAGGTYTELATVNANTATYQDDNVEPGTEYYYRVVAVGNTTVSEPSNEATVTTTVTGVDSFTGIPVSYSLSQNYPNPFNPTTTIRFELPEESNINITVFNSVGERVKELVNTIGNAGQYSVIFNARKLPSGVYLVRMSAESRVSNKIFSETKKILLMK